MSIKTLFEYKWVVLALCLCFWFGVLVYTGTLNSGFHFTDDHDLVLLKKDLSDTSFTREVTIFKNELLESKLRFRPFYVLHRRAVGAILGTDFFAWSVYTAFLAALTSFLLFIFMQKAGFSIFESFSFTGLTLLGPHAAIWWKLGANETLGMPILALAFWLMAKSAQIGSSNKKKKIIFELLFILCAILASWSKESFVLMIPALILGKIWLTYRFENIKKPDSHLSIWKAARLNLAAGIFLMLVFTWEVIHILKAITMTKVMIGQGMSFQILSFLKSAWESLLNVSGWILFPLIFIAALHFYWNRKYHVKDAGKISFFDIAGITLIAGAVLLPQLIMYMRTGLYERYLLPGVIGIVLLMIVILRYIRENSAGKKKTSYQFVTWILMILLLLFGLQNQLRITRYTAIGFAKEGKQTNTWLNWIKQDTKPEDTILIITNSSNLMETSFSLRTYLTIEMNRPKILFSSSKLDTIKNNGRGFWSDLNSSFLPLNGSFALDEKGKNAISAILILPNLEKKFLENSSNVLDLNRFKRMEFQGGYVSYYQGLVLKNPPLDPGKTSDKGYN